MYLVEWMRGLCASSTMKDVISIKDLKELIAAYSSRLGFNCLGPQTMAHEVEGIFVLFFEDYLKYNLSVDTMSSLCEQLFELTKRTEAIKLTKDEDIDDILILGAEVSWYVRNDPLRAAQFLLEMQSYHEQARHKHLQMPQLP